MKAPRIQRSQRDRHLVEVLTSEVTESWGRTCRAVFVIAVWRLRWWPVGVPVGLVVWLVR
jgi:hypothetical protein